MFNAAILDHFQNPRNVGELPAPAASVEVTNPACGDVMRLSVRIEQDIVREVRFKTRGCVASIACGSLLTELMRGKTLQEAARISASEIAAGLGGLPPESSHAGILAEDALQAALREARHSSQQGR